MQNEKKKKGLLAMLRESMAKTGGCCGPGETCGGTGNNKATVKGAKESNKTEKK